MSNFIQMFADKLKTIKGYPYTLEKAVFDDNGQSLENKLIKIEEDLEHTGYDLGLTIDSKTYEMTIELKNNEGVVVSSKSVDFPIESMVVNATYADGVVTLTLQNGTTLPVDISSIVGGLVPEGRKIAGVDLKDDITAPELRTGLGLATVATSGAYGDLTGAPSSLPANGGTSDESTAIRYSGTGNNVVTAEQTDHAYFGAEGWASYLIFNHHEGATYYHQMLRFPFWDPPQYQRLEGGNLTGWNTFITSENIGSQSVNYANGCWNADVLDGYHHDSFVKTDDSRLTNAREPYFANGTWYAVGDDVAIGDHNVGGSLCVKGLNDSPSINLYNADDSYNSTVITSATIGSQSVNYANGAGNADTVDGFHASTDRTSNTIVARDAYGYIYGNYFNSNTGVENGTIASFIYENGDGWYRKASIEHVRNQLGRNNHNFYERGGAGWLGAGHQNIYSVNAPSTGTFLVLGAIRFNTPNLSNSIVGVYLGLTAESEEWASGNSTSTNANCTMQLQNMTVLGLSEGQTVCLNTWSNNGYELLYADIQFIKLT